MRVLSHQPHHQPHAGGLQRLPHPSFLLTVAAVGMGCLLRVFVCVNIAQDSLPPGLYLLHVPRRPRSHLVLALLCLPRPLARLGRERGYLAFGLCPGGAAAVLKPVVAQAGDRVVIDARGVEVNGRLLPNSRPVARDHLGRPLTVRATGAFDVPAGEILAVSSYRPDSWDGRYWGLLPTSSIRAWAKPLVLAEPLVPPRSSRLVPGRDQRSRPGTHDRDANIVRVPREP